MQNNAVGVPPHEHFVMTNVSDPKMCDYGPKKRKLKLDYIN